MKKWFKVTYIYSVYETFLVQASDEDEAVEIADETGREGFTESACRDLYECTEELNEADFIDEIPRITGEN